MTDYTRRKFMKDIVTVLGLGGLASLAPGCNDYKELEVEYLEGVVLKESGTALRLVDSSGAIFGNDSVKLGNLTYVLTVKVDEGQPYTISVKENDKKPLLALAEAIEKGDTIKFPVDYCRPRHLFTSDCTLKKPYFAEDRIGKLKSDKITLVKKAEK